MNILLTNDDGIHAAGLRYLYHALLKAGHQVQVVAPLTEQSAVGHAVTLANPLRMNEIKESNFQGIAVNGTPADCIKFALSVIYAKAPDLVLSGINAGPNVGPDVMYSGTVAAATEGFLLGVPSLAVSLAAKPGEHLDTAVQVTLGIVQQMMDRPFTEPTLLNINVPDRPFHELRGTVATRLGRRHHAEPVVKSVNPRGDVVYWVGAAGPAQDAGEGTDFHAVREGFVSLTPLSIDLTGYRQLAELPAWLNP